MSKIKRENKRKEIKPSEMALALKEAEQRVYAKIKVRMLRLSKDSRLKAKMEKEIKVNLG